MHRKNHICICICLLLLSSVHLISEELTFTLIHTNDEHSSLVPSPFVDYRPGEEDYALGGYARLASFVNSVRDEKALINEPVLLFSAGDFIGGTPFAWLVLEQYAWELKLKQHIGYDAAVIGNHEFDYGPEMLASYLLTAGYPQAHNTTALLASNMIIPDGHTLRQAELKRRHIMELENGLTVGLFGLMGIDAVQVAPYAEPVTFSDQVEAAREQVRLLKEEGAEIIILLSHSGVDEEIKLASQVPGIHIIVGGHCHTLLEEPVIEGSTIIVQAGELLQHAGIIEAAYNRSTGTLRLINNERGNPYLVTLDSSVQPDEEIQELIDQAAQSLRSLVSYMTNNQFTDFSDIAAVSDFVLPSSPPLKETAFGNFVADAMRAAAEEATGEPVHAAFQANGMLRGDLVPGRAQWSEGNISFYDLASLIGLGFGPDEKPGYPLVSLYLTGTEIRRILEISVLLSELLGNTYFLQASGVSMRYDPSRAVLFTLPFADLPVPSSRAVMHAELHRDGNSTPLFRNDSTLYHVVSDYYLVAFLPMVGEMLPNLSIELKDREGNPITDIDDAVIYSGDRELKLWEAVVRYAASFPENLEGYSRIPDDYRDASNRLVIVRSMPLLIFPAAVLAVLIIAVVLRIRRRLSRTPD